MLYTKHIATHQASLSLGVSASGVTHIHRVYNKCIYFCIHKIQHLWWWWVFSKNMTYRVRENGIMCKIVGENEKWVSEKGVIVDDSKFYGNSIVWIWISHVNMLHEFNDWHSMDLFFLSFFFYSHFFFSLSCSSIFFIEPHRRFTM